MNEIYKRYEIVLSGDLETQELGSAEKYFGARRVRIERMHSKTLEPTEAIEVIMRGFDAYEFLRDGILFEFLTRGAGEVFRWFKKNIEAKRRPSNLCVHTIFSQNKGLSLAVNLYLPEDKVKVQQILEKLEQSVSLEYLNNLNDKEVWVIGWDDENDKVIFFRL